MITVDSNQVKIERIDDIPVIAKMLEGMGVQETIDEVIKRHGN